MDPRHPRIQATTVPTPPTLFSRLIWLTYFTICQAMQYAIRLAPFRFWFDVEFAFVKNIAYRNTLLGNTLIMFVIKQMCWNIRSRGFDLAQYCLLDVWWNMLIKCSKQIANSFAKIVNGYKGEFKTLSNIWDGVSASRYWLQRQTQNLAKTFKMELFAKIIKN